MKKNKLLSLFLAIIMVFSCVNTFPTTVIALGNPTFTVSSGNGNPGEDVTLTVDISNNPGICTATIWVHYDKGLKLKSVTDSGLLVGGLFGGDKNANPYGLGWDDSANFDGDNSSNGTLATLVFTIDPSAAAGDYNVWVTYNYGDIYNLDFVDFNFETVAGKITVNSVACTHKNTEIRNAVSASCKDAGYTGDTWCKDCNTKIADGEVIPATGNHIDANGKWESNGTQHFHTCTCGTEFDKANHSGGIATCTVRANCTICGTAYGELNNKNHTNTEIRDEVTESCNESGYTGDTWCKDCETKVADGESIPATEEHIDADGEWESDGRCHFRTCSCGTLFDVADHSGGIATCKEKAVCSVCNIAYGSFNPSNHTGSTYLLNKKEVSCNEDGYTGDTYCSDCNTKIADGEVIPATGNHVDADGKWESNGAQHFHTCACGTEFDKTNHSGGTASCKDKAICSICETAYGDYAEHNLIHHERVEPNYENDGNIEYWNCNDCGKHFSDADGNDEIAVEDTVIGKIVIKEYQFIDGEMIIEAPSNLMPDGTYFDVQKIVPPPAEIVEKVKEQRGESSEVLAYYEIRLINDKGEYIIHLDDDITIKTKMPEKYVGSNCVNMLQEDVNGILIEMDTWWEGEYLCYKTNWLEIYQ